MLEQYVEPTSTLSGTHIPKKGTYTLMVFVPSEKRIEIGRIGVQRFPEGYYAYTGTALGKGPLSLEGRISRHLKKNKKRLWHIDFLLADRDVEVISALIAPANERMECEINQYLQEKIHVEIPILKFGSSDCKKGCKSHLLHLGCNEDVVKKFTKLYEEKVGDKLIILDFRRVNA